MRLADGEWCHISQSIVFPSNGKLKIINEHIQGTYTLSVKLSPVIFLSSEKQSGCEELIASLTVSWHCEIGDYHTKAMVDNG